MLPALQALLGATLAMQSRPRPLRPLASLLRLLLAAISTFGRMLGASFVSGALHGTVAAVDAVLAEQVARGGGDALALGGGGGGGSGGSGGGEEAGGLEALISVSLRLLRLAADPPLSKAAERAALTEQVLAACKLLTTHYPPPTTHYPPLTEQVLGAMKPGRMGWLLGGAVELAPGLRLQVFEVAARVLQTHWQVLRPCLLWLHVLRLPRTVAGAARGGRAAFAYSGYTLLTMATLTMAGAARARRGAIPPAAPAGEGSGPAVRSRAVPQVPWRLS